MPKKKSPPGRTPKKKSPPGRTPKKKPPARLNSGGTVKTPSDRTHFRTLDRDGNVVSSRKRNPSVRVTVKDRAGNTDKEATSRVNAANIRVEQIQMDAADRRRQNKDATDIIHRAWHGPNTGRASQQASAVDERSKAREKAQTDRDIRAVAGIVERLFKRTSGK